MRHAFRPLAGVAANPAWLATPARHPVANVCCGQRADSSCYAEHRHAGPLLDIGQSLSTAVKGAWQLSYPGTPIYPSAAEVERQRRYREGRDIDPPRLVSGKPRENWTEAERRDAWLWNLGPRFRQGLTPPPEPEYYLPPIPGSESDIRGSWRGSMAGM